MLKRFLFTEIGKVFKKGDTSFETNLRDFLANCNNNDGIRFWATPQSLLYTLEHFSIYDPSLDGYLCNICASSAEKLQI